MVDEQVLKEFRIFVQSTSYNRNLSGGTTFLYQKENAPHVKPSRPKQKTKLQPHQSGKLPPEATRLLNLSEQGVGILRLRLK